LIVLGVILKELKVEESIKDQIEKLRNQGLFWKWRYNPGVQLQFDLGEKKDFPWLRTQLLNVKSLGGKLKIAKRRSSKTLFILFSRKSKGNPFETPLTQLRPDTISSPTRYSLNARIGLAVTGPLAPD